MVLSNPEISLVLENPEISMVLEIHGISMWFSKTLKYQWFSVTLKYQWFSKTLKYHEWIVFNGMIAQPLPCIPSRAEYFGNINSLNHAKTTFRGYIYLTAGGGGGVLKSIFKYFWRTWYILTVQTAMPVLAKLLKVVESRTEFNEFELRRWTTYCRFKI